LLVPFLFNLKKRLQPMLGHWHLVEEEDIVGLID